MNEFEVSVLVVTYNPSKEKIICTLDSIIKQKKIKFEIIIADDGSKENYFPFIEEYFAKKNFCDYKLVDNKVNQGTVCNIYSGISISQGKYVKGISPGDILYHEDTLRNWIDFMKANNLSWSFSEVINYNLCDDVITPVIVDAYPNDISIYKHGTQKEKRWNYYVLEDIAVGASMLGLRELQLRYCKEILNRVVYAEDNIWRMMMFDGIVGGYYPEYTVLYEYGFGVSTSNDNIWNERIQRDWNKTNEILMNRCNLDKFQLRMKKAVIINNGTSKLKKLFVKGKIRRKFLPKRKSISHLP